MTAQPNEVDTEESAGAETLALPSALAGHRMFARDHGEGGDHRGDGGMARRAPTEGDPGATTAVEGSQMHTCRRAGGSELGHQGDTLARRDQREDGGEIIGMVTASRREPAARQTRIMTSWQRVPGVARIQSVVAVAATSPVAVVEGSARKTFSCSAGTQSNAGSTSAGTTS